MRAGGVKRGLRRAVCAVVLACFASGTTMGCATTSYMPRRGPRVSVVMQNGAIAYEREGRVYRSGVFGGELPEAVRGNPQAEQFAEAHRAGSVAGFGLSIGGLAAILVSAVLTSFPSLSSGSSSGVSGGLIASSLLSVGGLGMAITGLIVSSNAQPRVFDAINAFNDGIPEAPTARVSEWPPGMAPPVFAPTQQPMLAPMNVLPPMRFPPPPPP